IGPGTTLLVPDENSSLSLDGAGNAEEPPRLGVDKPKYVRVQRNGRWVNVPAATPSGNKAVKAAATKKKAAPVAKKKAAVPVKKTATKKPAAKK
ncbi:hypothetical protein, partial [Cronobacter sakazakii]|uniref:hypothetical protein n=1 Tax=Cronobacter sakazakii TaxID=28141 RepID=UPI00191C727A